MGKKKNKEKVKQVSCFILDKSGSMSSIRDKAISGFNEYIQSLQKNKIDIDFTLNLFDTMSIEYPYEGVSIREVKPLNTETYNPMGGTPLYDACVDAIEKLNTRIEKMKGKVAVSVIIMTDGEENSSTKHDQKCLRDLVDKLTKKGNWTFAYMGANQDAWANAAKIGIGVGNTMDWASSAVGTQTAFRGLAMAANVRSSNLDFGAGAKWSMSTDNYFGDVKKDGDK